MLSWRFVSLRLNRMTQVYIHYVYASSHALRRPNDQVERRAARTLAK
jgi:hypothetical protein